MRVSRPTIAGAAAGLVLTALAGCGPTIAARVDDGVLTTRVRTALLYDAELATRRLAVTTVDAVVTLSGVVGSAEEAERAVRLARGVAGVRGVESQLTIRAPGTDLRPEARSASAPLEPGWRGRRPRRARLADRP